MMLAILGQLTVDPRVTEILDEGGGSARALLADLIRRLQAADNADPDWDPAHAAEWAQLMVDGLYLRCSHADFDADTELSRLRSSKPCASASLVNPPSAIGVVHRDRIARGGEQYLPGCTNTSLSTARPQGFRDEGFAERTNG